MLLDIIFFYKNSCTYLQKYIYVKYQLPSLRGSAAPGPAARRKKTISGGVMTGMLGFCFRCGARLMLPRNTTYSTVVIIVLLLTKGHTSLKECRNEEWRMAESAAVTSLSLLVLDKTILIFTHAAWCDLHFDC